MPTLIQVLLFVIELWKQLKNTGPDPGKLIQETRESFDALKQAKTVEEKHEARVRINKLINKL